MKTYFKLYSFLLALLLMLGGTVFLFFGCAWFHGDGNLSDLVNGTNRICTGPTQFVDPNGNVRTMNTPEDTSLCKIDPYWTESEVALFAFNAVALKKGIYTTQQALDFTKKLRAYRETNKYGSVGSFATYALALIAKNPEMVVVTKSLQRYATYSNLVLDDFTWYFFDRHMSDQDAIAMAYQE